MERQHSPAKGGTRDPTTPGEGFQMTGVRMEARQGDGSVHDNAAPAGRR